MKEESITNPTASRTYSVVFSPDTLRLDCVDNYTHSEIWLEINAQDVSGITDYLVRKGVTTKDEFDKIPDDKHWITDQGL